MPGEAFLPVVLLLALKCSMEGLWWQQHDRVQANFASWDTRGTSRRRLEWD